MSGQRYVTGSSVIPLTTGITNALEEIVNPAYQSENKISVFPVEIEMCRQDLLSEISNPLGNLESQIEPVEVSYADFYKFDFAFLHIIKFRRFTFIQKKSCKCTNGRSIETPKGDPLRPGSDHTHRYFGF